MSYNRFFAIQDADTDNSSGSALFSGSPVYGLAREISFAGAALLDSNTRSMVNPSIEYDNNHIGSNWSRRCTEISYTGQERTTLELDGGWTVGSLSNSIPLQFPDGKLFLTPHKFMRIARSGRPFYVKDEFFIPAIADGDTGLEDQYWEGEPLTGSAYEVGSSFYGKNGVKCAVKDYRIQNSKTNQNYVTWRLTLWEDKE